MIITVSDEEFNLLRRIIKENSEISLGDNKKYLIENRLSSLVIESKCRTFGEFSRKLMSGPKAAVLVGKVIEAITTNETCWFRDFYPHQYFKKIFLPLMADEIKADTRDKIRIWSAASSTGQEAYSIAMTALEYQREHILGKPVDQCLSIVATDISNWAVEKAQDGIYDDNDLKRGLPDGYRERYFKQDDKKWILNEKVKSLIDFSVFNLQYPFPAVWGKFDFIMLRNVVIYFSDSFKKILFEKITEMLTPQGILFLGTGETVSGYSDSFQMYDYKKTKYYKKK